LFATLAGRSIGVAAKGVKAGKVPPALFLKRYDSTGVKGWWSANGDYSLDTIDGSWYAFSS
jgi:hypothetical protein